MQKKTLRYSLMLMLVLVLTLSLAGPASAKVGRNIDVQILAINDFHGALEETRVDKDAAGNVIRTYGGAAYLATHVKEATAAQPNTIFVGDGDLIGASPLLSALFHDEPTILALNMMGMQYSTVGNHEFDEGWQELLRIQNGGCNVIDGCPEGLPPFTGASFQYLAANVLVDGTGKKNKPDQPLLPPYEIKNINGARIGFIGVDYQGTPGIVVPTSVEGLTFKNELDTINKYAKELKQMHVKTIVVLLHDGFESAAACNNTDGAFYQMLQQVDPEVDVVITGHTHQYYVCNVGSKLVTSAWYNGRMYTDINLSIDKATGNVTQKNAVNLYNLRDNTVPDQGVLDLIAEYNAVSAPIANREVGLITADITRASTPAGESALGDVITDGQLLATSDPAYGGAVIAITNPGGIRTDLTYAPDGVVTYGEAFAVQPFSNNLVTITLTGAQLKAVLEQQIFFSDPVNNITQRILQVSNGFTYTWDGSTAAAGNRISNMALNGEPMDMAASYRVTVNNFLAAGGDGFTAFTAGTDALTGQIDLDAFVDYLLTSLTTAPIQPGPQDRITRIN